jgi:hypothetical protein
LKRSGIFLLALLAARSVLAAPVLDLRLAYISQTLGEIEPCG